VEYDREITTKGVKITWIEEAPAYFVVLSGIRMENRKMRLLPYNKNNISIRMLRNMSPNLFYDIEIF
jgi:hypothetical protein